MKSIFVRVVGAFLLIVAIVSGIGFLLPRDYNIRSSVTIDAGPDNVFPHINTLSNWQQWSPWNSDDITGLGIKYDGPDSGAGATQTWRDPRGRGKLWITDSDPAGTVDYMMEFPRFGDMDGRFLLTPEEAGASGQLRTTVTWSSDGTLPSGPFFGYFAGMFRTGMQTEYDKGLANLKKAVESARAESVSEPAAEPAIPK